MVKALIKGFALICCLFLLTSNAQAGSILGLFDQGQINRGSDEDFEWLMDSNNNGLLDQGDRLRGALIIDELFPFPGSSQLDYLTDWDRELTAVFDIVVASKVDTGVPGNGRFRWIFAPYAPFATEFSLPAGSMIAVYDDGANNFSPTTAATRAEIMSEASDGSLVWALGFNGGAGEGWIADAFTDSPAAIGGAVGQGGTFNVGVNRLDTTGIGPLLDPIPTPTLVAAVLGGGNVDVRIFGGLNSKTPGDPNTFDIRSNMDAEFRPIPEPVTLTLFGFGLIGLAGTWRRKQKKA